MKRWDNVYIGNGIVPMTLSMDAHYNPCVSNQDVNKGATKMSIK